MRTAVQRSNHGKRRRPRRVAWVGFSLLEVMVAMAILAGALTSISVAVSRSVATSNHARMMTTATFLCRQKLVEREEKFIVDGFTDDSLQVQEKGDFEDPNFKRFRWELTIDKLTLPSTDQIQAAATKVLQDKQSAVATATGSASSSNGSGSNSVAGANAATGAMSGMLGPVKDMLEQGIRRVGMKVFWDEPGRPNQFIEVVTFYTDMRRIQL